MASPQTEQVALSNGSMRSRQSSQTGSREMRTKGVAQIRQSAGNRAVKRLSAARSASETKECPLTTATA